MKLIHLPFSLPGFEINEICKAGNSIEIVATSVQSTVRCPDCRVRLKLTVKRFLCQNERCQKSTFVENISVIVAKSARRTKRLHTGLEAIAFALGGQAGSRLTHKLKMPASRDTLLRIIRNAPARDWENPEIIGVDDWAIRKGRVYGTILVDLEHHRVIDLLPDRSAETLAEWLKNHPNVKIVARDRSNEYARGIQMGAPQAFEVADRWHLLVNLREMLERLIDRLRPEFDTLVTKNTAEIPNLRLRHRSQEEEMAKLARRQRRKTLHTQIHRMYQEGYAIRVIARQLAKSPMTIYKYLGMPEFPPRIAHEKRPSILDPYQDYLHQQWNAGCRNASQLWREIQAMGYPGTRKQVSRWAYERRRTPAPSIPKKYLEQSSQNNLSLRSIKKPPQKASLPVARRLVWLFLLPDDRLDADDLNLRDRLLNHPVLNQACFLAQDFQQMARNCQSQEFVIWLQKCETSQIPELLNFAIGLRKDFDAIQAAISSIWSNGQTEGQVNRLKMLKRQMYGRAGFDLLKFRFTHPP